MSALQATKIQAAIRGTLTRKRLKRDPHFSRLFKTPRNSLGKTGLYDGASLDDFGHEDLLQLSHRHYEERKKLRDSVDEKLFTLQSDEDPCRTGGREKSQLFSENDGIGSLSPSDEEDLGEESKEALPALEPIPEGSAVKQNAELGADPFCAPTESFAPVTREEGEERGKGLPIAESPQIINQTDEKVALQGEITNFGQQEAESKDAEESPEKETSPADAKEHKAEGGSNSLRSNRPAEVTSVTTAARHHERFSLPSIKSEAIPAMELRRSVEAGRREREALEKDENFKNARSKSSEEPVSFLALALGEKKSAKDSEAEERKLAEKTESAKATEREEGKKPTEDIFQAPEEGQEEDKQPAMEGFESAREQLVEARGDTSLKNVEDKLPEEYQSAKVTEKSQMPSEDQILITEIPKPPEAVEVSPGPQPAVTPQNPFQENIEEQTGKKADLPEERMNLEKLISPHTEKLLPGTISPSEAPSVLVEVPPTIGTRNCDSPEPQAEFVFGQRWKEIFIFEENSEPSQTVFYEEAAQASYGEAAEERDCAETHVNIEAEKTDQEAASLASNSVSVGSMSFRPLESPVEEPSAELEEAPNAANYGEDAKVNILEDVMTESQRASEAAPIPPLSEKQKQQEAAVRIELPRVEVAEESQEDASPPPDSEIHFPRPEFGEDKEPTPEMSDRKLASSQIDAFIVPLIREPMGETPSGEYAGPPSPQFREDSEPSEVSEAPKAHDLKMEQQPTFRQEGPQKPYRHLENALGTEKHGENMLSPQTVESLQHSYRTPSFPVSYKTSSRDTEGRAKTPEVPTESAKEATSSAAEEIKESIRSESSGEVIHEEVEESAPKQSEVQILQPVVIAMFEGEKEESKEDEDVKSASSSDSSEFFAELHEKSKPDSSFITVPEALQKSLPSTSPLNNSKPRIVNTEPLYKPPKPALVMKPITKILPPSRNIKSRSQDMSLSFINSETPTLTTKKVIQSHANSVLRQTLPSYSKRPTSNMLSISKIEEPRERPKRPKHTRAQTTDQKLFAPTLAVKRKPSPYDFQWSKRMLEKIFRIGVEVKVRPTVYLPDMRVRKLRKAVVHSFTKAVDLPDIVSTKGGNEREFLHQLREGA